MTDAILSLDIGSSSARAMVCDRAGRALSGEPFKTEYQFARTADGGATCDPDAISEAVFTLIDRALDAAHDVSIVHVAVDTFVTSLVGVDSHGEPTTPLYTWADGRGGEYLPALKNRLGAENYRQRTGCYVHPSYWPLRLAWLREAEPDAFAKTQKWLSLGAYLTQKILSTPVMSISDAAWTGLLDRHRLAWDGVTLAALGVAPETLPEIRGFPADKFPPPPFPNWDAARKAGHGRMAEGYARRWPQLTGARWHPAIGDGAASNIGAGCTQPHQIALSIGTSGAMRVLIDGTPETVPDGLFCYRVDSQRSLVGGALSNAGSVYHWLTQTLKFDIPDDDISRMTPDAHGLTVLPFLAPERAPYWDDSLPAAFTGMTAATTPADFLRAGLESVAYGFARIAGRLLPMLPENAAFTANGGASDSPVLMQILADVLRRPVAVAAMPEATIRGAALFVSGEIAEPETPSAVYRPDAARGEIYAAAMARQTALLARFR